MLKYLLEVVLGIDTSQIVVLMVLVDLFLAQLHITQDILLKLCLLERDKPEIVRELFWRWALINKTQDFFKPANHVQL